MVENMPSLTIGLLKRPVAKLESSKGEKQEVLAGGSTAKEILETAQAHGMSSTMDGAKGEPKERMDGSFPKVVPTKKDSYRYLPQLPVPCCS